MAFMRSIFAARQARQPRTRRTTKGTVTDPGYGPKLIAAILDDGTAVVVDVEDGEWHDKSSAVPSASIIGEAYRRESLPGKTDPDDGKWFATFVMPQGGTHVVKDDFGRMAFPNAADAALACLARRKELMLAELAVLADPVAHLTRELSCHDWYCHMSDAPGVCGAGEAHMRRIVDIAKDVDPATVRELWLQHAPHGFTCPV